MSCKSDVGDAEHRNTDRPSHMTNRHCLKASLTLPILVGVLSGCSVRNEAPRGYAIVRDNIITAPRNFPPVETDFVVSILKVDGAEPVPESIPPLVDQTPGAQVTAGHHKFRARVKFVALRRDMDPKTHLPIIPAGWQRPRECDFEGDLVDGVVYFLVGDAVGNPVFIMDRPRDK